MVGSQQNSFGLRLGLEMEHAWKPIARRQAYISRLGNGDGRRMV